MLRSDVEVVHEVIAAFNSGEIERILALTHADFEAVVPAELSVEPDTYRGHAGIRRYFESFQDAMEDIRFEVERLWDAGSSVVALVRLSARGKQTAIAVEQEIAQVWTVRAGAVTGIRTYARLSQALAAAGLPQGSAPDCA